MQQFIDRADGVAGAVQAPAPAARVRRQHGASPRRHQLTKARLWSVAAVGTGVWKDKTSTRPGIRQQGPAAAGLFCIWSAESSA